MRTFKLYSVFVVLLLVVTGAAASAAPNVFGVTGILEMPNDITLPRGAVSLGYHWGFDAFGDDNANFFTGTVGITTGLEVGIGFVDPDDRDNSVLLNAKYRIITETLDRPAVTVGVVDAAADLDIEEDDPGLFILLSKTLTRFAEEVIDEESKPLRGHIGFGTGVYKGLITALSWQLTPKLQASFEYVGEGLNNNDLNGLIRWAWTPELRLDVGTIDFDSFVIGISYTTLRL